jgi:ABC-2 type transport system ATP-binding protein
MNTQAMVSIKVEGLKKSFGQTLALDSLDINLDSNLLHGIIGPDGAGKTTLLRIITGLLHPTEGRVEYFNDGKPVTFDSVRPHIGYMPSRASLYADLSINEHLSFFKNLYSLDYKHFRAMSAELMRITRLEKFGDRKIGQLSGGMYKKVGLMCAMLQSPSVLLLDEPTNGVDPISRREFWDMLYQLLEQKILIVIATAYMDEAERCGRIHLLDKGKSIIDGEPGEILQSTGAKDFNEVFIKIAGKNSV